MLAALLLLSYFDTSPTLLSQRQRAGDAAVLLAVALLFLARAKV